VISLVRRKKINVINESVFLFIEDSIFLHFPNVRVRVRVCVCARDKFRVNLREIVRGRRRRDDLFTIPGCTV